MSETTWIFLIGQGVVVVGAIITASFKLGSILTEIKTRLHFIEQNCPACKKE
jgi:hypothetical protein